MTDILKPCPFCGGEAKCIEFYGEFHVICCDCHISGRDRPSIDGAIEAWNTRPAEDELKKYEAALIEICFCCAAVDCSLEQQSEALKAIDKICAEFYSGQNKEA